MPSPPDSLVQLRQQMREHFPAAHAPMRLADDAADDAADEDKSDGDAAAATAAAADLPIFKTGVAALDRIGLPPACITELVGRRATSSTALLTHALLQSSADKKRHLALIDSRDHFDPHSADLDACQSLLWLRCDDVESSLKAADLLLRDGNLPLVVADFQLESPRALRAVPTSSWHRLRALAEKTGVTMLFFTPAPLIPTAHLRLNLKAHFPLDALNQSRKTLLENIPLSVSRRIGQHHHSRSLAAAG